MLNLAYLYVYIVLYFFTVYDEYASTSASQFICLSIHLFAHPSTYPIVFPSIFFLPIINSCNCGSRSMAVPCLTLRGLAWPKLA
ncbi:hypothetical protein BX661DRAFT_187470 [Kickxella alabastrina]|uniref:uncharacterized protein n=1 Tax=Kickxella alabastrina TaxID=61397 RepID=UPI002220D817|nr:uncharacterized protein BX661DRAFT_187470 [Kickxella alabastrina]KAI7822487.1 hypothetical protein BX661DRAFT_187470 [Kickxella alabastrina]